MLTIALKSNMIDTHAAERNRMRGWKRHVRLANAKILGRIRGTAQWVLKCGANFFALTFDSHRVPTLAYIGCMLTREAEAFREDIANSLRRAGYTVVIPDAA